MKNYLKSYRFNTYYILLVKNLKFNYRFYLKSLFQKYSQQTDHFCKININISLKLKLSIF